MANVLTHKEFLERLYKAALHFYPLKFDPNAKPWDNTNFQDTDGAIVTLETFNALTKELTGQPDINRAIDVLTNLRKLDNEELTQTVPTIGQLEEMTALSESRLKEQRDAIEKVKKDIQESIDRKTKVKIQGQVHADVRVSPSLKEINAEVESIKKQVFASPEQSTEKLTAFYKQKLIEKYGDKLSASEINYLSQKTAIDTVNGILRPDETAKQAESTAIFAAIAKDEGIIPKLGEDATTTKIIQDSAKKVSESIEKADSRKFVEAINPDLAEAAFGPSPERITVYLYSEATPTSKTVDLKETVKGAAEVEKKEVEVLDALAVSQFSAYKVLVKNATANAAQEKTNLPKDNADYGKYDETSFLKSLEYSSEKIGKTEILTTQTVFYTQLVRIPTVGTVATGPSAFVASSAAKSQTVSVATIAAAKALGDKLGTAAAKTVTAVTTSLGVPALGKLLEPLIKNFVSWLTVQIAKNKDKLFIIGGALLGIGVVGGLAPLAVLGGGLVLVGWGGGATLGSLADQLGVFVAGFGSLVMTSLAAPLIGTLIGLPVLIVFILFIINSGAYVVPPQPPSAGTVGLGASVNCTDEKGPVGVGGPGQATGIANRAWEISADLYQGFWCFWNRSPKAPPPNFPNDVLLYPPGYPNLFDYSLFRTNPNPAESSGPNLFWCTWIILKAYGENGNTTINTKDTGLLYVPNMYNAWPKDKIIPAKDATPQNIVPGSVVFFQVSSGEFSNRLNHVGVVYSVDPGGIWDVESNNAVKSERIVFTHGSSSCTPLCLKNATPTECGCNNTGSGVANLPGMQVKYFGLP